MFLKKYLSLESGLAHLIGCVVLFSTLNFHHMLPSLRNLNLGLQASFILALGLLLIISKTKSSMQSMGWSTFMWLYFFIIILIQPLFVYIAYPDGQIFILIPLLICTIISQLLLDIKDKNSFISVIAFWVLLAAILQSLTVFAHVFRLESLYGSLVFPMNGGDRPMGNLAQPNQAAFLFVLGINAFVLFYQTVQKKVVQMLLLFGIVILSAAVCVTVSRGGLIMLMATIMALFVIHQGKSGQRIKLSGLVASMSLLGYYLASVLISQLSGFATISDRIQNAQPTRMAQQEQALLIFQDNPIFGIGFGQFIHSIVHYGEQTKIIQPIDHSHVIFTQILSELGILGVIGLLPFFVIVFRNLSFFQNPYQAYIYTSLGIFALYSMSEYPLWYFYFLILFVVFLGLLDTKIFKLPNLNKLKNFVMYGLVLVVIGSGYFYWSYIKYAKAYHIVMQDGFDWQDRQSIVFNLPQSYGFSKYREFMLFTVQPISSDNLKAKIGLGERVVLAYPMTGNFSNLSFLYGLNNDKEKAMRYSKLTCLYFFGQYCDAHAESLADAAQQEPEYYQDIYHEFEQWRKTKIAPKKAE